MSAADECTRCQAPLQILAAFCGKCGQIVDRTAQMVVPEALRRVADRHRGLMRAFLFYAAVSLAVFALAQFNFTFGEVFIGVYIVGLVLVMVCVISLASALDVGVVASVFLALLCLFPPAGLIVILLLSKRAAMELRDAGIPVGFLGARKADVEVIATVNRCRTCGYDLRGLTSPRCPECGVAFTPTVFNAPTNQTAHA